MLISEPLSLAPPSRIPTSSELPPRRSFSSITITPMRVVVLLAMQAQDLLKPPSLPHYPPAPDRPTLAALTRCSSAVPCFGLYEHSLLTLQMTRKRFRHHKLLLTRHSA